MKEKRLYWKKKRVFFKPFTFDELLDIDIMRNLSTTKHLVNMSESPLEELIATKNIPELYRLSGISSWSIRIWKHNENYYRIYKTKILQNEQNLSLSKEEWQNLQNLVTKINFWEEVDDKNENIFCLDGETVVFEGWKLKQHKVILLNFANKTHMQLRKWYETLVKQNIW